MNSGLLISVYSLVKKCAPAVAVLTMLATPAHAERALTLDETLKLARDNNRDLKAARENLALVQATVETVRAQLLPTVAAQGKYTYNYPSAVLDAKLFSTATDTLASTLQATSGDPIQKAALQTFRDALAAQSGISYTIAQRPYQLDFSGDRDHVPLLVPGAYPAYQSAIAQKRATSANIEVTQTNVLFGARRRASSCRRRHRGRLVHAHAVTRSRSPRRR